MKRYVEEQEILRLLGTKVQGQGLNGQTGNKIIDPVRKLLKRAPTAPDLISRKVAAEILGVQSPHIARYEKQNRMPEPIPVEGTASAYVREEVEALRDEIAAEKKRKKEASK